MRGSMIKKVNVAGIQLDNYTVRESIMLLNRNMEDQSLYAVEEINMEAIIMAGADERMRKAFHMLDHTIISESAILDAVGQNSIQRRHEIEDHTFFFELMKRLERNHKRIFLLANGQNFVEEMHDFIKTEFPRIEFAGLSALENCLGASDSIINEINVEAPDAVISMLPDPEEEYFLLENKEKLSTTLWYGIGEIIPVRRKKRLVDFVKTRRKIRRLEKHMMSYSKETRENN